MNQSESQSDRSYSIHLKDNKDPFIANEPVPVPTELSLESHSGTPNTGNNTKVSPDQPEPMQTPIQDENKAPLSHFIEDLDVALKQWIFGLSWRRTTVQKAGIINKLIGKKQLIDLDLSCLLFDASGKILERVWFKNVRDNAESIRHRGDSLDGTDRGDNLTFDNRFDQEKIDIFLEKIPANVYFVTLVLSSFHGQVFADITEGYCHLSDDEGNIITQLNLTKLPRKCKAIWVATLAREVNTWQFTANKQPLNYHRLAEFEQQIEQFLVKMQESKYLQSAQ